MHNTTPSFNTFLRDSYWVPHNSVSSSYRTMTLFQLFVPSQFPGWTMAAIYLGIMPSTFILQIEQNAIRISDAVVCAIQPVGLPICPEIWGGGGVTVLIATGSRVVTVNTTTASPSPNVQTHGQPYELEDRLLHNWFWYIGPRHSQV